MPLLYDYRERRKLESAGVDCPGSIPWDFAATQPQCQRNHGQAPERLAERGGLSAGEALAILKGQSRPARSPSISDPAWLDHERRMLAELLALVSVRP